MFYPSFMWDIFFSNKIKQLFEIKSYTVILTIIFVEEFILNVLSNYSKSDLLKIKMSDIILIKLLTNISVLCFLLFLASFFISIRKIPLFSTKTSLKIIKSFCFLNFIITVSANKVDPIYRVISSDLKKQFDDSFKLIFSGDLILLEDQVRNAYNGSGYDFTENFEYTKKYISPADLAIGVFEGPMAGSEVGYSSGNYDDRKYFYVNYPDEWADAIKNAGFDLVTTANNHLMDRGIEGVKRTIKVLNEKKINFVGSYLDKNDKESKKVKILERQGIKFAILAYTYGINRVKKESLVRGNLSHITSMIVDPRNEFYEKVKSEVKKDFEIAKSHNPDIIVVLPHWGTQFSNNANKFQEIWRKNFIEFGADIIFGDHTHSVQPVFISKENGKNTATLYCPGNYANVYRKHNGDFSALVEVFIDRKEKKVIGGSVIPMWTASSLVGNYRPLPIYDILTDKKLGKIITTHDLERIKQAQNHITKVMLGEEISIKTAQSRYYFDEGGFLRNKIEPLELSDALKAKKNYQLISTAKSICFVGDSITEGTKNGGVGWYEPLESYISGKIFNHSKGGITTKRIIKERLKKIVETKAELFIIAIGTNDVRYRSKQCSLTSEEFISNLSILRDEIKKENPESKFIFIAPWTSTDGDRFSKLRYKAKIRLNNEYSKALEDWVKNNKDIYVDPNDYINSYINVYSQSKYLIDYIHPNSLDGVQLYSKAFLEASD